MVQSMKAITRKTNKMALGNSLSRMAMFTKVNGSMAKSTAKAPIKQMGLNTMVNFLKAKKTEKAA